jgi:2-oxoisovalerate dehydrogenase E1 component
LYATEVAFSYATRNPDVASRGAEYGLPGVSVDGNNVLAVYEAAQEAVERARLGGGPTLIECRTYRTRSHAEGMRDIGYRTSDEVEAWKARDPLKFLQERMLADGIAVANDFDNIEAEMISVMAEAVEFAKNSAWPDPATATHYVFSEAVQAANSHA